MAQGFGTVEFSIYTEDGTIPAPTPGELCDTYTATVKVASSSDMATLYAYFSKATEKPAMGGRRLGTVVVEWGDGVRTLTFPIPEGGLVSCDAILISIAPTANMLFDSEWSIECGWILTTIPIPVPSV